jgi:hypothetical protein
MSNDSIFSKLEKLWKEVIEIWVVLSQDLLSAIKEKLPKNFGQHDPVEIRTVDFPNKILYIFYVWQVTKLVM